MRNKPQQLSAYAKKLLREQDNQIQNLSSQLNEWKELGYQFQRDLNYQEKSLSIAKEEIDEINDMNLFQLFLWWVKK